MLVGWLGGTSVRAFVSTYLGRLPCAQPGTARTALGVLDWPALDRILASPAADVLVVARGELLELPRPRSLAEARALMACGIGLVIRRTELAEPAVAALAAAFAEDLPGTVHVQVFVTPGGTHGFGWHFDDEDVFIAQTAGVKDYYFRANTIGDAPAASAEFRRFAEETSPLATARLLAGDFLYLPSRWWHMAKCVEDSLSISLGIIPSRP